MEYMCLSHVIFTYRFYKSKGKGRLKSAYYALPYFFYTPVPFKQRTTVFHGLFTQTGVCI